MTGAPADAGVFEHLGGSVMHGRIRRAVLGVVMVAAIGAGPLVLSQTAASANFPGLDQGCTPGYWKNHIDAWSGTAFSPTQTVGSVFTLPADLSSFGSETLLDALNGAGGPGVSGATEILLRAAVAALLNATDSQVAYPAFKAGIKKRVNTASRRRTGTRSSRWRRSTTTRTTARAVAR